MSCDHRPDMASSRGETSTVKGVTLSRALDLVSMAMFWYLCMCQLGSVIHRSLAIRRAERITYHECCESYCQWLLMISVIWEISSHMLYGHSASFTSNFTVHSLTFSTLFKIK